MDCDNREIKGRLLIMKNKWLLLISIPLSAVIVTIMYSIVYFEFNINLWSDIRTLIIYFIWIIIDILIIFLLLKMLEMR